MNRTQRSQFIKYCAGKARSTAYRSILVLITLCILAASYARAAAQTATYSDTWVIDNSGVTYDPDNDADVIPQEQGQPNLVAGVGVTEADYDSQSEAVQTTLTSPDGRSVSDVSYDNPYARVEVTLTPMDGETEYQYDVETVHSYWVDESDPPPDCGPYRICPVQAAYRALPGIFHFFRVITRIFVRTRWVASDYQFTGTTVPFPYHYRICWMGKICGSCGRNTAAYVKLSFQTCPTYLGIQNLRYSTPFGSWCVVGFGQENVLFFCS
jgi:opacity protein-like surface antigen